jgi:hypothetical protein
MRLDGAARARSAGTNFAEESSKKFPAARLRRVAAVRRWCLESERSASSPRRSPSRERNGKTEPSFATDRDAKTAHHANAGPDETTRAGTTRARTKRDGTTGATDGSTTDEGTASDRKQEALGETAGAGG